MPHLFCIRIEFLLGRFHGMDNAGEPEWPPSPLRLFQALTAACAGLENERVEIRRLALPLRWLEQQSAPLVIVPRARRSQPYRLYVPNNTGDLAASAWAAHRDRDLSAFRTEKDLFPIAVPDGASLYYVWQLAGRTNEAEALVEAASAITHLGWGIDQVATEASWLSEEQLASLPGVRFYPDDHGGRRMRVPFAGTFDALSARHQSALTRLRSEGSTRLLVPVPRITAWAWKGYATQGDPRSMPSRVFALTPVDGSTTARYQAYDPVQQTVIVSGMLRGQLLGQDFQQALGWSPERLTMFHGHGEAPGAEEHLPTSGPRLAVVPLPSNEYRGGERGWTIGSTRRLLITMLKGHDEKAFADISHLLGGRMLRPEDNRTPPALLTPIEADDRVRETYLNPSSTWATVTPVVLPGHEDRGRLRRKLSSRKPVLTAQEKNDLAARLNQRIEALLRKSIVQAGYSEELAQCAEIEWRTTGFFPGTALSNRYFVPSHLQRYRKYHMKVTWRDATGARVDVPGPVLLGGGRFIGMGLLARC